MTDSRTIHKRAQDGMHELGHGRLDEAIVEFEAVIERIPPLSPDAEVIGRAIDQLDELARAISDVETMLAKADFSFGKVEVL
jgi:hypothetical protein